MTNYLISVYNSYIFKDKALKFSDQVDTRIMTRLDFTASPVTGKGRLKQPLGFVTDRYIHTYIDRVIINVPFGGSHISRTIID